MDLSVWLALGVACFVFSISPGPAVMSCMSYTISKGTRAAVFNVLGLQTANVLQLTLVSLGLGAVVSTSPRIFSALKLLGAGYLLYLGVKKWREEPLEPQELELEPIPSRTSLQSFLDGLFLNIFNPKSIIFLAGFIPNFIRPDRDPNTQFLVIAATILAVDLVVMGIYGSAATFFRTVFSSRPRLRLQNRVFGTLFIGAGLLLAVSTKPS